MSTFFICQRKADFYPKHNKKNIINKKKNLFGQRFQKKKFTIQFSDYISFIEEIIEI